MENRCHRPPALLELPKAPGGLILAGETFIQALIKFIRAVCTLVALAPSTVAAHLLTDKSRHQTIEKLTLILVKGRVLPKRPTYPFRLEMLLWSSPCLAFLHPRCPHFRHAFCRLYGSVTDC